MRCGDHHSSSTCTKSRDAPPRCALCFGEHPANYRGCSVYKDLQNRKKPHQNTFQSDNIRNKKLNVQSDHPVETSLKYPNRSPTYAQVTSNEPPNNLTSSPVLDLNKIMSSFIDDFKQLINPLIALLTKVISSLLDKK